MFLALWTVQVLACGAILIYFFRRAETVGPKPALINAGCTGAAVGYGIASLSSLPLLLRLALPMITAMAAGLVVRQLLVRRYVAGTRPALAATPITTISNHWLTSTSPSPDSASTSAVPATGVSHKTETCGDTVESMQINVQFAQKAVIESHGKILLVQKSMDDPHQPGRWELPGGRLKPNESLDDALIREVREEVGLEVSPGHPLAIWSWTLGENTGAPTIVAVARLCAAVGVDVTLEHHDEDDFITGYGWFDPITVLDLDLIPSARQPITAAIQNLAGLRRLVP